MQHMFSMAHRNTCDIKMVAFKMWYKYGSTEESIPLIYRATTIHIAQVEGSTLCIGQWCQITNIAKIIGQSRLAIKLPQIRYGSRFQANRTYRAEGEFLKHKGTKTQVRTS